MPKKCGNCGGTISEDEEIVFCDNDDCRLPYHRECVPDKCLRCKEML